MKNTTVVPVMTFNAETIRDFCGSTWNQIEKSGWDPYICTIFLYHLPDAVDKLCRYYHFNISGGPVDESKKLVYKILVKELEDVIPEDWTKWEQIGVQKAVYEKVFSIKYLDLGERLRFVCQSIIESDYWKAQEYIYKHVQGDMQKILLKAVIGNKLSKVNMKSFTPYYEKFGV